MKLTLSENTCSLLNTCWSLCLYLNSLYKMQPFKKSTIGVVYRFNIELVYQIAAIINTNLDLHFPEGCGVDRIAHRRTRTLLTYYITSIFTLSTCIQRAKEGTLIAQIIAVKKPATFTYT